MKTAEAAESQRTSDFERMKTGFADDLNKTKQQIETAFLAIRSIQEPANYWATKCTEHNGRAKWWAVAAILCRWTKLAWCSYSFWRALFPKISASDKYQQAIPLLLPMETIAVVVVALYWAIRILVRFS